jgi:hypothetical protein
MLGILDLARLLLVTQRESKSRGASQAHSSVFSACDRVHRDLAEDTGGEKYFFTADRFGRQYRQQLPKCLQSTIEEGIHCKGRRRGRGSLRIARLVEGVGGGKYRRTPRNQGTDPRSERTHRDFRGLAEDGEEKLTDVTSAVELPAPIRNLQSATAICNLQFAICNLQSAIASEGQLNREDSPAFSTIGGSDAPTMQLDQMLHDREPQSGAAGIACAARA